MALQAGEAIDESDCGDLLFSSTAPLFRTEPAAEPRHHQPHVFVLLSADAARAATAALIVSSTNARYDDWAEPVAGGVRGEQARPDRDDARRAGQVRARHPRSRLDCVEAATPVTFAALHQAPGRRQLRHEVRGPGRQPGAARADRRAVPCRQRGHHHVRLAGRDELRRDRGQRRRMQLSCYDASDGADRAQRKTSRHEPAKKSYAAIPHREPFLLVDEIVEQDESGSSAARPSRATRTSSPGIIPVYPLVPGVLLCEAAMQAGAVLLVRAPGRVERERAGGHADERRAVQAHGPARRDDPRWKSKLVERLADAFFLKAKVTVDGKWPCGSSSPARRQRVK